MIYKDFYSFRILLIKNIFILFILVYCYIINNFKIVNNYSFHGDWGLGIGDWGLGIWGCGP